MSGCASGLRVAEKQKTKLLRVPKRPFITVSLEGDKDLIREVKGILEAVLDWKITEDEERYVDWLEHLVEGDKARIRSNFFLIKKWKYVKHKRGEYPFQSAVDLWKQGFVPSFDGETWRLHAGQKARVVFEVKKELLSKVKL